jgi:hypothetical protein
VVIINNLSSSFIALLVEDRGESNEGEKEEGRDIAHLFGEFINFLALGIFSPDLPH